MNPANNVIDLSKVTAGIDFGGVIIPHDHDRFIEDILKQAVGLKTVAATHIPGR